MIRTLTLSSLVLLASVGFAQACGMKNQQTVMSPIPDTKTAEKPVVVVPGT